MTGEEIRELSCSNCGAGITPTPGASVIECEYCGRSHTFVAPPPKPKKHVHKPGDSVAVLWGGQWWKASVVEVHGADRWKIHYDGWSSSYDEVVGPNRIRDLGSVAARVTDTSSVRWILIGLGVVAVLFAVGGILFSSSGGATGNPQPTGAPVTAETPLGPNARVEIQSQGSWWPGRVLGVNPDGTVHVTYDDYGSQWDESVDRSRLRLLENPAAVAASKSPVGDAPLVPGQRLEIYWNDAWYPGSVVQLAPGGKVKVHYDGYPATQDEIVDRSRLRHP